MKDFYAYIIDIRNHRVMNVFKRIDRAREEFELQRDLGNMNARDFCICTNECPTVFMSERVRFIDGKFYNF